MCLTIEKQRLCPQSRMAHEESDDGVFLINTINQKAGTPVTVCIQINDKGVKMEVVTGASITIMSENTQRIVT